MQSGIYTLAELQTAIAQAPEQWRPLVFTNGCFDLLHAGHVRYLRTAKTLGRALVVGLNSDASVRTIKPAAPGRPPRPLMPELQRAEVLAALKPVDGVVLFDQTTASDLVQALQPDIYVKGGDYQLATLPEAAIAQSYGGRVELVPFELSTSTTGLVDRILQAASLPSLPPIS